MTKDIERWKQWYDESIALREKYSDVFSSLTDTWADVDYATHPIRPWCKEEVCIYCTASATHKIEETTGRSDMHPYTAYVCCGHFFGYC